MWCATCDGHTVVGGICHFQTIAAALLLAAAVAQGSWHVRRISLLQRVRYRPLTREKGIALTVVFGLYAALAALHLAAFLYEVIAGQRAPFAVFYDAALLASWAAALLVAYLSSSHGIAVRWRLLALLAAVVYAANLVVALRGQAAKRKAGMQPHALVHSMFAGAELLLSLGALLSDFIRGSLPAEESEALKQALLGNPQEGAGDVEAPPAKRSRSWTSLLGTALVFVWPDDFMLQARAATCLVIIILVRLLNLAVPIVYKSVIDDMSAATNANHPPGGGKPHHVTFMQVFYPYVLAYLVLYFFQGGSGGSAVGLLSNLRQYLWIPITQNAYRRISLDLFSHMLDLDLHFHLHRKTGEVMRILDRGTAAIQNILGTVIFSILPQMVDIGLACVYIAYKLEAWIAVIVFVTLVSYIPITIYLTEWRGAFRRDLNLLDNAKGAKATDALLNYETVKYFTNEKLERDNFATAIGKYQKVEYKLLTSLNALNIVQSLIIFFGMAAGLSVCARGVANGSLTVGDTVLFITLMQQLYAPLNYFGTYYRSIQQYMIDLENIFDLLATHPQLQDAPGAKDLVVGQARVAFEGVSFEYSAGTPVLQGVNFTAEGGATIALVGATGSGKSTCLRLLFRFYDAIGGRITIDGQDISKITQSSLRTACGVVPQDTVLFNDSILYNIRYGRPSATDEEVFEAARAASIHEAIMTRFPQGYSTVVGERGLRLSGGEKQRVAFARTILKNPAILLLDEATSALDSLTEAKIQEALLTMRQGRTSIIIAHRLSTVMDADLIVVMRDGEVAETGTHAALIQQQGLYSDMWSRQQEAAAGEGSTASSRAASRNASAADLQAVQSRAQQQSPLSKSTR